MSLMDELASDLRRINKSRKLENASEEVYLKRIKDLEEEVRSHHQFSLHLLGSVGVAIGFQPKRDTRLEL